MFHLERHEIVALLCYCGQAFMLLQYVLPFHSLRLSSMCLSFGLSPPSVSVLCHRSCSHYYIFSPLLQSKLTVTLTLSSSPTQMWNLEFVQVPDEAKTKSKRDDDVADASIPGDAPVAPPAPARPTSQSIVTERLHEFKDMTLREVELGSSAESDGNPLLDRLREQLDHRTWSKENTAANVVRSNASFTTSHDVSDSSSVSRLSVGDDNDDTSPNLGNIDDAVDVLAELEANDSSLDKQRGGELGDVSNDAASVNSAASTNNVAMSPGADFVMVTDSDVKAATPAGIKPGQGRMLRPGFRWQRQLVFCSKLTMHTAFERKDNKDPAVVTAIAVSRQVSLSLSLR